MVFSLMVVCLIGVPGVVRGALIHGSQAIAPAISTPYSSPPLLHTEYNSPYAFGSSGISTYATASPQVYSPVSPSYVKSIFPTAYSSGGRRTPTPYSYAAPSLPYSSFSPSISYRTKPSYVTPSTVPSYAYGSPQIGYANYKGYHSHNFINTVAPALNYASQSLTYSTPSIVENRYNIRPTLSYAVGPVSYGLHDVHGLRGGSRW